MKEYFSLFQEGDYSSIPIRVKNTSPHKIDLGIFHIYFEYFSLAEFEENLQNFENSLKMTQDNDIAIKIKAVLAWYYLRKGQFAQSKELTAYIFDNYNSLNNEKEKMMINLFLSTIYHTLGELEKVEILLKQLKENSDKDDLFIQISISHIENQILVRKGEYDLALVYYRSSLQKIQHISNTIEVAKLLMRIGVVYLWKGENDQAKRLFKNCLNIFKQNGLKRYQAFCTNNLAGLYKFEGNRNEALDYFLEAIDALLDINDERSISRVYHNIADTYHAEGDFQQSEAYYLKSLEYKKKLSNKMDLAITYHGLGDLFYQSNRIELAKDNLEKALDIFKESGNIQYILKVLEPLLSIYRDLGDQINIDRRLGVIEQHLGNENKVNRTYAQFIYAVHNLKTENDTDQAIMFLKNIVDADLIYFDIHVKSILQLLHYYAKSKSQSYVSEADAMTLLSKLYQLAMKGNSSSLQFEAKLLQTRFHLINEQIEQAKINFQDLTQLVSSDNLQALSTIQEIQAIIQEYDTSSDYSVNTEDFMNSLDKLYQISSNISNPEIEEEKEDISINPNDIAVAFFKIGDLGPQVIEYDLNPIANLINDQEQLLGRLSITIAVITGQGHDYHEGVYDLPPPSLENYRLILITFSMKDPTAIDLRLQEKGFFQFGLFIPKELHAKLPSSSKLESLISIDKLAIDLFNIDKNTIYQIRNKICREISLS